MKSTLDISKLIAGVSFILGTLLLVLFLFFKSDVIIGIGIYYVLAALVINLLLFIGLIGNLITSQKNRFDTLKAIGITLINLPIAIAYFFIVLNAL